jgi:hypothetical protein
MANVQEETNGVGVTIFGYEEDSGELPDAKFVAFQVCFVCRCSP